jgi:hypothetical protein
MFVLPFFTFYPVYMGYEEATKRQGGVVMFLSSLHFLKVNWKGSHSISRRKEPGDQ